MKDVLPFIARLLANVKHPHETDQIALIGGTYNKTVIATIFVEQQDFVRLRMMQWKTVKIAECAGKL